MRLVRRRTARSALIAGLLLAGAGAGRLWAQGISLLIPLTGDSIAPSPVMVVEARPDPAQAFPVSVSIEVSAEPQFRQLVFSDAKEGDTATFIMPLLLPERTTMYFRARLIDRFGTIVAQTVVGRPIRSWIRLGPPGLIDNNNVLFTRTPRFAWSAAPLTLPPGPWIFDLSVVNTATNRVDFFATGISDTAFVFATPLEGNTSYRWRVRAHATNAQGPGEVTITSRSTFVISSADVPTVTLFYQNFPNPFSTATCFWFDLATASNVRLTIYDLRLREVKNIVPGLLGSDLPPGAYGRENNSAQSGCDGRLSWDGTDDDGRVVPPGVYLAQFRANGKADVKRILFRGR
jgi:hypothetical protein